VTAAITAQRKDERRRAEREHVMILRSEQGTERRVSPERGREPHLFLRD